MKAMKKITVTFMALIMVVAMIGMFAVNVSAAKETVNGFTVQVIDLVAVDRDGTTTNYGTRESTFAKLNMTVVNSTTVKFTYNVWFASASGAGDSQAREQEVTVNDYSCTKDLDVSIDKSFSQGGDNWTYKMKITKSAGHLYDNACDTNCNICGQTRTVTHNYQNGTCTVDAVCTVCGDVKAAPGHNYVSGSCTECGEACSHTGTSSVVVDLQDGTHREQYNCCGKIVKTEPHKLTGNNGFCSVCDGYEPAVLNGDVYEISNAGQLYWFAQHVNKGNENVNARLMADIVVNKNVLDANGDLNGAPESFRAWIPIGDNGDNDARFEGSFYGDGHTVSGLYSVGYGTGFFYYTWSAKIYNLGVLDSYFFNDRGGYATGAIIGYITGYADSRVENCFSNATIAGATYLAGGLFGTTNTYPQIINCYYFGKTVGAPFIKSGPFGSNSANNFYVSTATDNYSETTAISASALASGELAYLLNGSVGGGSAWGQVIGTDAYPLPIANDNNKVYYTTRCNGTLGYENYEKPVTHDASVTSPSRFNANGECLVCGTKAVAKVVTTGNVTNMYTDIHEAAAYAVTQHNSTLTLLADVDLADGKGLFEGLKGKLAVTLDLNGKTLSSANSSTINWDSFGYVYTHYTLTINDSVGTGKVINTEWHAVTTNAGLTINGGYFEGCWELNHQAFAINCNGMSISYNDTITINGGEFYSNNGIFGDQLTYFVINGGSFRGDNSVIHSSYEGLFVINNAEFPEGLVVAQWSAPISKLLAPGVFLRDENGKIITLTATAKSVKSARSASAGADLAADGANITINSTTLTYTGLQQKPTATVVIGGYTLTEGVDYELSWSNNVNVGTDAVITVRGKGSFSGEASENFEIAKGTLSISEAPVATYAFGDTYVGKTLTGGKVVAVGNSSLVVSGTWTWVEGTDKATFTPDAQYADLFETFTEQVTVTKNVVAGTPILTITSPSPSIMPGMSIRMSVETANSFDSSITDLPTQFKVTYKVNGGTPVTVSGLVFTLPTSATLGDTVEVYVENVAVEGKYSVGRSNVIELTVGQVDYTSEINRVQQNLDDAINALNEAIAKKADAAEVAEKVAKLDEAYKAADALINSDIADLEAADAAIRQSITDLEDEMKKADKALEDAIKAVDEKLDAAKTELQNAIDANEADIEDKVAKLDEAYKAADALINSEIASLKADDAAIRQSITDLEDEMKKADKALEDAIKAVDEKLDEAKTELQNAIDANEADIEDKVAKLDEAYKAADTLINSEIANLKADDAAIRQSITDLEDEMKKADKALEDAIKAVQDNLDAAKKELQDAIDANEKDIEDKVAKLDEAYKAADALINSEIASLKADDAAIRQSITDLEDEMKKADKALEDAIKAVDEKLDEAKEELQNAIDANEADIEDKVAKLDEAYKAADALINSEIVVLKEEDVSLYKTIAELEEKTNKVANMLLDLINGLEGELNSAKAELAQAISDLETAMNKADSDLSAEIEALGVALENAKAALEKADKDGMTELTAAINEAYDSLDAAIKAVQKELDDAKAALEAKDAELTEKTDSLMTFVTVVCVIAVVSLVGSGAFIIWFFVDKKKKI